MPCGPDILEDFAVQSSHSIGFWFSINRAIADMGVGTGYFGLKFSVWEDPPLQWLQTEWWALSPSSQEGHSGPHIGM